MAGRRPPRRGGHELPAAQRRWEALRYYTFGRYEAGTYYRRATLESAPDRPLYLADVLLPNGILQVDQYAGSNTVGLRLSHYALPNPTGTIRRTRRVKGHVVSLIDNGTYQLALVALAGSG